MSELSKMGIEINDCHSYFKYGLYLASRDVTLPSRQTNFVTIPYMDGYYDFGAVNGTYYGARTLTYSFDILEPNPQRVELVKNEVYDWAKSAIESKLYDDADPGHYFVASFVSADFVEDSELPEMGGQITLTFQAQPYRYDRETDEAVI